ncbi:hypothetical protein OQA88_6790 [Cercophora sp. LCS_1]
MRILGGRIWRVAVAALPFAAANGNRVDFNKGFEGRPIAGNSSAVLSIAPNTHPHRSFHWVTTDPLEITKINLWVKNMSNFQLDIVDSGTKGSGSGQNSGEDEEPVSSATVIAPSPTTSRRFGSATDAAKAKRADPITGMAGNLEVTSTSSGGLVIVPDLQALLVYNGMPLFFEAVWPDGVGRSYSRAFTVVLDTAIPDQVADFVDPKPFQSQIDSRNGAGVGPGATSSGALAGPTGESSPGGLPTGAIAGIAAGCSIVGLFLIAFLVWFLLRRRRQQQEDAIVPYGTNRTRTDELMAEKEANAGVDQSPHSPYSDVEGSLHQVHSGGTAAAMVPPAPQSVHHSPQQSREVPRSFTPYSDRPSVVGGVSSPTQTSPVTATDPTRIGADAGRVTPHGLPAQYAHLVEEGMTEDEIRRLEEEERQLDAAIERAGRRP